jgi:hypothetical protein
MVLEALAALHQPEIADKAPIAAAHADQPTIPETRFKQRQHDLRMHYGPIPSMLDGKRIR